MNIKDLMSMITPTIKGALRDEDILHRHLLFMRDHNWITWYNTACIFTIYPNASNVNHLEEWIKKCKDITIKRGQKAIPIMTPVIDGKIVWQEELLYDINQLKLPKGFNTHVSKEYVLSKSDIDLVIEKYTVGDDQDTKKFLCNCLYFTFGDCIQFNLESRLQLDVTLPEGADEIKLYCDLQSLIHLIQSKQDDNEYIKDTLTDDDQINVVNEILGIQNIIIICKEKLLKKKKVKKEEDNNEIFKEPMNPNQYPVYRGSKDL